MSKRQAQRSNIRQAFGQHRKLYFSRQFEFTAQAFRFDGFKLAQSFNLRQVVVTQYGNHDG